MFTTRRPCPHHQSVDLPGRACQCLLSLHTISRDKVPTSWYGYNYCRDLFVSVFRCLSVHSLAWRSSHVYLPWGYVGIHSSLPDVAPRLFTACVHAPPYASRVFIDFSLNLCPPSRPSRRLSGYDHNLMDEALHKMSFRHWRSVSPYLCRHATAPISSLSR